MVLNGSTSTMRLFQNYHSFDTDTNTTTASIVSNSGKTSPVANMLESSPIPHTSFVEDTNIHGIKEAWRSSSRSLRFLWAFILLGCFCGVNYEIFQIVVYYRSNPSASQVKWVIKEYYEYPPMVFCPKTFISLAKVKRMNMSKSALAYTVSLFQEVKRSTLPKDFDIDEARLEIRRLARKFRLRTYLDLFSAIAFDGPDVMVDALTSKPIKMEVYVPGYGLCYRLHFPPVKKSTIKSVNHLEVNHVPSENHTEYDLIHDATLLVRDTTGVKADMIFLSKNAYYQIDFQVQLHKRLSHPSMECWESDRVAENYYVTDCEVDCLDRERYAIGCVHCLPFRLLKNINDSIDACGVFVDDVSDTQAPRKTTSCEEEAIIWRSTKCLKTCVAVCEQWMYKHTTLIYDIHNSSVYIRLLYNPSDGILTYEEVATYNFDTFISNIGGQLGLWLGASVVSIFQIFYYSCLAIFRKKNEKGISKI